MQSSDNKSNASQSSFSNSHFTNSTNMNITNTTAWANTYKTIYHLQSQRVTAATRKVGVIIISLYILSRTQKQWGVCRGNKYWVWLLIKICGECKEKHEKTSKQSSTEAASQQLNLASMKQLSIYFRTDHSY